MIHALHGNFGLPSDWDAALPPGVPAKAWHLWEIRQHHPETHTLTGFASWFNDQIEALPPEPHRLLAGYSLGGRLALHVLADRPALWHRALLLSTHPGLGTLTERTARLTHDLAWQARCLHGPWPEVSAAWNAQPVLRGTSPPPGLLPLEPWRQEIAGAFDGWSLGHQENLLPALALLPCTGRWLAGANDHKFSHLARVATAQLPGFNLLIVPQAGHRLTAEKADIIKLNLQQMSLNEHGPDASARFPD